MSDQNLPDFASRYVNMASRRLGTTVEFATDDFFADKSGLIRDSEPVWIEDKYEDSGKWMDGWESRRRRGPGHDYCLIKLGAPTWIKGICIDTSHFTGNYPAAASLEAAVGLDTPDDKTYWRRIVGQTELKGDHKHYIEVGDEEACLWLRLNIYPDGGIARLRVYGHPDVDWPTHIANEQLMEVSGLLNAARIIGYSDAHYGRLWPLLAPDRAENMGDGWETRRRRSPGFDWIVIALGHTSKLRRLELDTAFFKGNYPDEFSLHGARVEPMTDQAVLAQSMFWPELVPRTELSAHTILEMDIPESTKDEPVSHVRLNIYPDGGLSRLRLFGIPVRG
ncbi:MAG: allantoicase [Pseudomonadota bacterium]